MKKQMTMVSMAFLVLLAGGAGFDAPAAEETPVHDVDMASAQRVIAAALAKAKEQDTKMNITIVDAGGNLKAFVRMDGAYLGSIDVSMKKAKTSRLFDMPSGVLGGLAQPGGPLYGIELSNDGLILFPGGIPLQNSEGVVVGAIGVSGSSVENDEAVAKAGAAAF